MFAPTAGHGRGAGEASVSAGSVGEDQPGLALRFRGREVGEGVSQTVVESVAVEIVKLIGERGVGGNRGGGL